jgi:NAD+ synthase (glutamine-hydrolysing)
MDNIQLNKDLGFLRLGAAVPELRIANIDFNVSAILSLVKQAVKEKVQVVVFPELAITGYTMGDLVQQDVLLSEAERGLGRIIKETAGIDVLLAIGMPVVQDGKIFNCAVVLDSGRILGVVPKTFLPSYREFYEDRWFSASDDACSDTMELAGQKVPFGRDILFRLGADSFAVVGVEICEDLWIPLSPHEFQAASGATVLLNLSASNEILGKADWRRTIISSESGRCIAAYCCVSSGAGESSNDVIFGGHGIIAENGVILQESERLSLHAQLIISDVDIDRLNYDRRMTTSLHKFQGQSRPFRIIEAGVADSSVEKLWRNISPHPFVPAETDKRDERCREIFSMQVAALSQKLAGAGKSRVVLGVSGGLDSTLALLVAVKTMDYLKLPRSNVYAYSLSGFGTTQRTRSNAAKLCGALGVSFERIDIKRSCSMQLRDLGHGGEGDVVFENVQARYRTQFLFNKANQLDGIAVGTGNLTEAALGWCTFAGDQMSHYHINVSVPKTLVRDLVQWVADVEMSASPVHQILYSILKTPISPELIRPQNGKIAQKSEDIIGPMELADFYLYPFVRFGMRPGKILYLADEVRRRELFDGQYTLDDLYKWLKSFIKRFFANQFKRTCFPEGPKVGSVSLSPRGDWRMPSDASPAIWLRELDDMYNRLRK